MQLARRFVKTAKGTLAVGKQILHVGVENLASLRKPCTTSAASSPSGRPLEGIRVLDLTRVLAGPYCTMILGDLGAEVIKVEEPWPSTGDETRSWGPPFLGSESTYFLCVNRNKKSITVNFKTKAGAEIIKKLARSSDVLVENFLPGKLAAYGLDYKSLSVDCPSLVYCSITGYGQSGPYAQRPGYDVAAAAVGGLMHITGPKDGEPCKVGVAVTDLSTGLYAYGSIVAALLRRTKTGTGVHIDCNLLATQVASLVNIASNYLNAGVDTERQGTAHVSIVPYQAFATADGYIVVGAGNNNQFASLCQLMDLDALNRDPRYATNSLRVKNRIALLDTLSCRFKQQTTAGWLAAFSGCNIPYAPLNTIAQVFADPQVAALGLIQEMAHITAGVVRVPGPAVRFSAFDQAARMPPPLHGEHTGQVLSRILGLGGDEIERLRSDGVV